MYLKLTILDYFHDINIIFIQFFGKWRSEWSDQIFVFRFVQIYPDDANQYVKSRKITIIFLFNSSISNKVVVIFLKIEAMKQFYAEFNDNSILHD